MPDEKSPPTIAMAVEDYIGMRVANRSQNTARTYTAGLDKFLQALKKNKIDPTHSPTSILEEKHMALFIRSLASLSASSEQTYTTAVFDFYKYLDTEGIQNYNLDRIRRIIKQRGRPKPERLPTYPKKEIEQLIDYADSLFGAQADDERQRLRNLRDRALILVLADTGLRIHEACNLVRGNLDRETLKAIVIGKGNRQAVVRFTARAVQAIDDYLSVRTPIMDGNTGKPLGSLHIFARHDMGAGKRVKQMSPKTGDNILALRVAECLGPEMVGIITPHTLRHRFVTEILRKTGNLKLAKDLARHKNIAITQIYAHLTDDELDEEYKRVFEK